QTRQRAIREYTVIEAIGYACRSDRNEEQVRSCGSRNVDDGVGRSFAQPSLNLLTNPAIAGKPAHLLTADTIGRGAQQRKCQNKQPPFMLLQEWTFALELQKRIWDFRWRRRHTLCPELGDITSSFPIREFIAPHQHVC